jgi:hypothetical protein
MAFTRSSVVISASPRLLTIEVYVDSATASGMGFIVSGFPLIETSWVKRGSGDWRCRKQDTVAGGTKQY